MFSRLKKAKLDGATGSSSGVGGDKVNKTISKKSTVSPRKASKGEIKVVKRGKMSKATTHSEVTSEGGGDGDDKDEDLSDIEDSEDKDVLAEDQSDSGQEVMQSQGANGFTTVNHAIASEDEEA